MSLLLHFCYPEYMRLNKFIAHASGVSRREADNLIDAGSVLVNGKKAQLGCYIDPVNDIVFVNGKKLVMPKVNTTIMLNKPVGYVCSRNAQAKGVETVYALLPDKLKSLKTVGRLDKDSSGLILLTNDGDLAHRLTHPSFAKNKEYIVQYIDNVIPFRLIFQFKKQPSHRKNQATETSYKKVIPFDISCTQSQSGEWCARYVSQCHKKS